MKTVLQKLRGLLSFPGTSPLQIASLPPSAISLVTAGLLEMSQDRSGIFVCPDTNLLERMAAEISWFGKEISGIDIAVDIFPDVQIYPYGDVSVYRDLTFVRSRTVARLLGMDESRRPRLVLTTLRGLTETLWPPSSFRSRALHLSPGHRTTFPELETRLISLGYRREEFVEDEGCFSIRGEIVDVFSPLYDRPVRLDFFDDTIESLRIFDPTDQRSVTTLESAWVIPAREVLPDFGMTTGTPSFRDRLRTEGFFDGIENFKPLIHSPDSFLTDYFPGPPLLLLEDPESLDEACRTLSEEFKHLYSSHEDQFGDCPPERLRRPLATFLERTPPPDRITFVPFRRGPETSDLACESLPRYAGDIAKLRKDLVRWAGETEILTVASVHEATLAKLQDLILDNEAEKISLTGLRFTTSPVEQGFILGPAGFGIVTDLDIYERKRHRRHHGRASSHRDILSFLELKSGDPVVHENHGIGLFRELVRIEVEGRRRDFLLIEYAGGDKLYVPLDQINYVQKYVGHEGREPELSRLGSPGWDTVKARIKESLREFAAELLKLYSVRRQIEAFAYPKGTEWERRFELLFEYPETRDQEEAIRRVKEDMEKPVPMDRLVCGDAGFGKTEVAMRAAFKAAASGKQAAILVPTTVLAEQHLHTFRKRFADFPFRIEVLNRFRSAEERSKILADLRTGHVDIVIGTHTLLSSGTSFRDLGLLVIDEEQKFGVKHKERIKTLRKNVHVLSMSATPIPRTLHFSLAGIRDISVIQTPPFDRLPVATHILPFEERVVREAIESERARKGQVFFIHNEIETIEATTERLRGLVPSARVEYAHAQMDEDTLEEIMLEFYDRRIDVLVATTIVESGLDLPNVNTIFIDNAHEFGLAQLYQLKGRVGRSNRRAFAYLLVPPTGKLTDGARKRLETVNECTELGAGIRIALRDLEIRGAGNIFGTKQHGNILTIGLDMYLKLMDAAVRELRKEPVDEAIEPHADFAYDGFIPDAYIPSLDGKIRFYREIARCRTEEEVEAVESELADRFGRMPPELRNIFKVKRMKILGSGLGIVRISAAPDAWSLRFSRVHRVEDRYVPSIMAFLGQTGGRAAVNMKDTSEILLRRDPAEDPVESIYDFLKNLSAHVKLFHPESKEPPT
jgi:transcription-repair coupling factor (superfamily II helicase)